MASPNEEAAEEVSTKMESKPTDPSPQFMEVVCKSTGKVRRFAAGTEAGFAANLINRKVDVGHAPALYIEAVKEGEEPISFGPKSILVNYGQDWILQTVVEQGFVKAKTVQQGMDQYSQIMKQMDPNRGHTIEAGPPISLVYVGKILVAFAFIFTFGAFFAYLLEHIPYN